MALAELAVQTKRESAATIEAVGNKLFLKAMEQQAENIEAQQTIAMLNRETASMRLELANIMLLNPELIPAMEAGSPPPAPEMMTEPTIETEGNFQAESELVEPTKVEPLVEA